MSAPALLHTKEQKRPGRKSKSSEGSRRRRHACDVVPPSLIHCEDNDHFDDDVSKITGGGEWNVEKFYSLRDRSDPLPSDGNEQEQVQHDSDRKSSRALDGVVAENNQLREINTGLWKKLQSNQAAFSQRTRRAHQEEIKVAAVIDNLEAEVQTLKKKLAASRSIVEPLEQERDESKARAEEAESRLAAVTNELEAAKDDNRKKSRQMTSLQHRVRASSKDLDRTKQSLKDKIRRNVCMEMHIETLQEDLQERSFATGSTRSATHCSSQLSHASDDQHRSSKSFADDSRIVSTLGEIDDINARHRKEKDDTEKRHRAELERVRTEAGRERDEMIKETNRLETMLLKEMDSSKEEEEDKIKKKKAKEKSGRETVQDNLHCPQKESSKRKSKSSKRSKSLTGVRERGEKDCPRRQKQESKLGHRHTSNDAEDTARSFNSIPLNPFRRKTVATTA